MKVQEVILRAISGQILWTQAAEILGMSDRSMRRWRERLEKHGYDGLLDRRRQRPSPKRVPMATVEEVLRLYRDRYFDFNVRHFHEKLVSEHRISLSHSWVKAALQGAGLVARLKRRASIVAAASADPYPGCCCTSTGVPTHGWGPSVAART
jgi:transposase